MIKKTKKAEAKKIELDERPNIEIVDFNNRKVSNKVKEDYVRPEMFVPHKKEVKREYGILNNRVYKVLKGNQAMFTDTGEIFILQKGR